MRKYVAHLLRQCASFLDDAQANWTYERRTGAFTAGECETMDLAFKKFDEGFSEIDKMFDGWRSKSARPEPERPA